MLKCSTAGKQFFQEINVKTLIMKSNDSSTINLEAHIKMYGFESHWRRTYNGCVGKS